MLSFCVLATPPRQGPILGIPPRPTGALGVALLSLYQIPLGLLPRPRTALIRRQRHQTEAATRGDLVPLARWRTGNIGQQPLTSPLVPGLTVCTGPPMLPLLRHLHLPGRVGHDAPLDQMLTQPP